MMLVAKRDKQGATAASTNLSSATSTDVDFGVAEVKKMFEEMASASGQDGWKVEVDKKWWKVETKKLEDGLQYNRSGMLVDLSMEETMEMMLGYENPRMTDWLDHIKTFQVVKVMQRGGLFWSAPDEK